MVVLKMIGAERFCSCGHRCHCYRPVCPDEIGVGMTDKSQPCGCKKCTCKQPVGFFDD